MLSISPYPKTRNISSCEDKYLNEKNTYSHQGFTAYNAVFVAKYAGKFVFPILTESSNGGSFSVSTSWSEFTSASSTQSGKWGSPCMHIVLKITRPDSIQPKHKTDSWSAGLVIPNSEQIPIASDDRTNTTGASRYSWIEIGITHFTGYAFG